MTSILVNALVPLGSVLLGAALTYYLSVRERRHTAVEDQFNAAITAVAVADASRYYLKSFTRPEHMSDPDFAVLLTSLARAVVENHTKRATEAREAVARVIQYAPELKEYYEDPVAIIDRTDESITVLRDARARHT